MPPKSFPAPRRSLTLTLTLLLAIATGGCGSDPNRPKLGKVHGKVLYKGQPVTSGSVTFVPVADSKGGATGQVATGKIESDGSYELTTFNTGDGAILGQHLVTIQAFGKDAETAGKPRADGSYSYVLPKSAVPRKYAETGNTPLRHTVEPGTNTIDLELKD